jgi:hypothetical protein
VCVVSGWNLNYARGLKKTNEWCLSG